MYEVSIRTEFSAAHQLQGLDGKFENLHGHNWTAVVMVEAREVNAMGVGVDFVQLKRKANELLSRLDYKNINEIPPFDERNPSAENIARWLFDQLAQEINGDGVRVRRVEIYEMPGCGAAYYE